MNNVVTRLALRPGSVQTRRISDSRALARVVLVVCAGSAAACARPSALASPSSPAIAAQERIVTPDEVTTEQELAQRAERALTEQRWADAAAGYRVLVSAYPTGVHAAEYLLDLGLAREGLRDSQGARDAYLEVTSRFPDAPVVRVALVHAATLDAYLEDWTALGAIGAKILARVDLDDIDRIVGLGARGLSRVEQGDDQAASPDVLDALDLADKHHYGPRDVLPVAVAQAQFALGEIRRVRSERIAIDPPPIDFLEKLEERCGGLLDAQTAYSMTLSSVDPHWAAMAGLRVASMYRALHHDVLAIPPPANLKTDREKQAFYVLMHVRYRVLLEKGLRQIEQTIALGERTQESSNWLDRAREAESQMQRTLAEERDRLAGMPFTEDQAKEALRVVEKKLAPPK
ncbi:MAG: hypothetical protein ABTD50_13960 [Polyangiaceae bacterium]|jgi:hypothetical protein